MRTIKLWRLAFAMLAASSFASCTSDPEWADPEAHEKTVQLQKQYEPLTFEADGTLTGMRRWQVRRTVTVDGREMLTDWENIPEENGTFVGTWKLLWLRKENCVEGVNRLRLYASYQGGDYLSYSEDPTFGSADAEALRMRSHFYSLLSPEEDGWITFQRGEAEPSF